MGVINDASCKKCRRTRTKLFLKGERCHTAKCAIEKRNYPPGIRALRPAKISEYARRLLEKQKLRFFYGVSESQIREYFDKASTHKGVTGHNMLSFFERRVDNIVFRTSVARSRREARQMVRHGKVLVNNRELSIPSAILSIGDEVSFQLKNEQSNARVDDVKDKLFPAWLAFDAAKKSIRIVQEPKREEIDVPVEEHLIVEYYSK